MIGSAQDARLELFVDAARETFSLMLGLERLDVVRGAVQGVAQVHEISAVIGFGGAALHGALVMSTDRASAARMISRLAGEELGELDEAVADGLGELANIVAGAAKSRLEAAETLQLGLPTIVVGGGHRIFERQGVETRIAFVSTDLGPICLQVHIRGGEGETA